MRILTCDYESPFHFACNPRAPKGCRQPPFRGQAPVETMDNMKAVDVFIAILWTIWTI
jgi:hypothetical protein